MTHQEYLALVEEINRLRNLVHLFNTEEISEAALDDLKHKVSQYEAENPDLLSRNSPNYTIAGGIAEGFTKFTHTRRMLSLNDIFSWEELEDWQTRWQNWVIKNIPNTIDSTLDSATSSEDNQILFDEVDANNANNTHHASITTFTNAAVWYVCEPKIDGLALSLHYNNGQLIHAATRGNGFVGEDVTQNALHIQSIPKKISDNRRIEVRGEVFLTHKHFEELNKSIADGQQIGKMGKMGVEAQFANPRNAAAGTLRQLNSKVVAQRNLSFIAYNIFINQKNEELKV